MDYSPVLISIKTASISIVITFLLGIFLAGILFSYADSKISLIIDSILTLPIVLPPTVAGFLLLIIFGVNRPLGRFFLEFFGVRVVFNWSATVLAAVVISFPLMYRSAIGAFKQVDPNLIYAARTLGMSEGKIFWKVLIPNAKPGIISGTILAFARGLGEFGATMMIAGNIAGKTRTLPVAVYSATAGGDMETANKYVLILLGISFVVVLVMNYLSFKQEKR
ncbi:MAG: molybdate ABC transporter permease subunit [Clostridiales bacterium]|nr:molybdate ABC transporter permease subunit [Clostridiales bacterium]